MILNTAPQDQAIISNVGEIGEFRIRNSAKAFSILSSGLYANKIRAIIRELSCNAVDSHTAAGKQDTPFDVHLPNQLEPWFAIRDYGTGLSHEQVTNIYTTYFESTKTSSNDFIGALGLGSKSPFSYTDNFTVTAVKDNRKGIYTAFINEQGVPSIALMMEETTDDPSGVEVKFSVNDRWDFDKFRQEAQYVYTYFVLRPVVSGANNFQFRDVDHDTKDIVPGIHSYRNSRNSVAVMGNISYPIEVPNADQTLGDLRGLLSCGLEMHFAIGELDFQASREGLSYIPQTIEAIKRKLIEVNAALSVVVAKEADAIPNLWDRAIFLYGKYNHSLWTAAVKKYVADTKLPTFDDSRYGGTMTFKMKVDDLAQKYNISIRGFTYQKGSKSYPNLKTSTDYNSVKNAAGHYEHTVYWAISVQNRIQFVVNDTKTGAVERAKYHYRATNFETSAEILVLDRVNKDLEMDVKSFFKDICNPPAERIVLASTLEKKQRSDSGLNKNVTILHLEERGNGGYYRQREMVWRDAGKVSSFDATKTYYYLPLSGFNVQSSFGLSDVKQFYNDLRECGIQNLNISIYGVRKGDLPAIQTQKNWVNIEQHLRSVLSNIGTKDIMPLVVSAVDRQEVFNYNVDIVDSIVNQQSPYVKLVTQFKGVDKVRYNQSSLERLSQCYAKGMSLNPDAFIQKFISECSAVSKRYPLLDYVRGASKQQIAEYINLVDNSKGI